MVFLFFSLPLSGCAEMRRARTDADKIHAVDDSTYAAFTTFGAVLVSLQKDYIRPVSSQTFLSRALDGVADDPDFASPRTNKVVADAKSQLAKKNATDILGQLAVLGDAMEQISAPGRRPPRSLIYRAIAAMAGGLDAYTRFTCSGPPGASDPKSSATAQAPPEPVVGQLIGNVAYIRIGALPQGTAQSVRTIFASLRARAQTLGGLTRLIVDLMSNHGGLIDQARAVAGEFLPTGALIATTKTRAADTDQTFVATSGDMTSGLPVAVLVDARTGAGAEIIAGALQENHRAKVFGQTTGGHGTVQTIVPTGDDCRLALTTGLVILPSAHALQGRGIVPDTIWPDKAIAGGHTHLND
jgi:carboxyl-terminal processing protease